MLQTSEGFEAVRCSGLPEKLTFDRVPVGLSAEPDAYPPETHLRGLVGHLVLGAVTSSGIDALGG